ncbi:WD40-repeat-containing domain protein [Dimargaris cristalligena]|uniref:WD40-repeat-containing domain protein n=1 Tax=Dimargaris cristalligena TaxID=215637 RepID=A0A4V1J496_9FUNG|nr:WD40-repeat-containing domain protein [Dimargaris cristalligena]|eukprot:RKP34789.1 WD40-repeat-containing domain protein [Dimargaris cristalligena]
MDIPKQKRKVTVAVPVLEYVDPDESDSADRTDWLNTAQTEGPAAAWQDEDDEVEVVGINRRLDRHVRQTAEETHLDGVELQRRLRTKFEQINPTPDWAQTEPQAPARAQAKKVKKAKGSDSDEDTDTEDDPDAIFRSTQPLLAGSGSRLAVQPSKYSPKRRAEVARFTATEGRLQSIAFHPTAHILMTTTSKGTLQLYDIDGRRNVLIQNIKFPGDRLQEAHFTPAGDEIIAIANRRTYYSYHIPTGQILTCKNHFADNDRNFASVRISPDNRFMGYAARGGHIGLVSPKSRTLVHRLKMDHTPTDLQWSHDSNYLYALDPAARCLVWDVRMLRTVHTFHDQGGFKPTTLALSPDRNHYSVIGSETGLVNIYDHQLVKHTARPTPLKTIDNLTTPISHLQFNSDGQFLLINSETAEMGLRLFHMPTRSVLARWPMITGDTQRVNHAAFAHDSRYLAMHDDSRSVVLYEMPGY